MGYRQLFRVLACASHHDDNRGGWVDSRGLSVKRDADNKLSIFADNRHGPVGPDERVHYGWKGARCHLSKRDDPHGSRYVYEIIKGKVILKVAPGLAKVPSNQGLFLILLVLMASIGAAFGGYYVDTGFVHKPLDVFGVCNPPATLQIVGGLYNGIGGHEACLRDSVQNRTVNGQVQQVVVQVPAGSFFYLNGSKAAP